MEILFWVALGLVAWCYLGYPLAMALLARLRPRPVYADAGSRPTLSVILAARNEAHQIGDRVRNLLEMEYPPELMDIIVVCNGCTDGTEERVAEVAESEPQVRHLVSPAEDGKAGALNRGAAAASGDILLFADARQRFEPDVARRLVAYFADDRVGAVSGRLEVEDSPVPALRGVRFYWQVESALRQAESATGSVMGATGAVYAVRRRLFEPFPQGLILDDVWLPMRMVVRGHRVVLAPEAVARDRPVADEGSEFDRKLRTMVGNVQLLREAPELLSPRRNPAWTRFVSHKVLRLATPLCLIVMLAAALLADGPFYRVVAVGQLAFYGLGALGLVLPLPGLGGPAAFLLVHGAVLLALLQPNRAADEVWKPAGGGLATPPDRCG